ncbi:MAG TPA: MFS transporter [Candidatus Limnocylindrales bacterium]|nr:MFS transporter [Candidatus Limnocylindrales bacterium]
MNVPRPAGGRFGPFHHRAYRAYWLGVAVSSLGTWLSAVAGSIYVYQLTGSTISVGIFNAASFLPILLFSVWGGQVSDRFDRRRVVLWTHAMSMAIAAVLAAVTIAGAATEMGLIVAMFLLNTLWALGKPSLLALVPNIVPRHHLQDAVALGSLGFMTGQVVGPLIAAGAMAASGAGLAFAINAVTYGAPVVAMIVLGRMGLTGREWLDPAAPKAAATSAVAFVRGNLWAAGLLAGIVVTSTAMEIQRTVAPALASETLGVPESNAALLLFTQSVGSAISFLLFIPIRRRGWSRASALAGVGLQGIGVVVAAFAPSMPIAASGFFLIGLGFAMCFPVLTAALQEATPDDLRGRIMAYHQLALLGHRPITALAVGVVAAAFGLVVGTLAWLVFLPVGLLAIREAWRRLPVWTVAGSGAARAKAGPDLPAAPAIDR